jgi:iron complex transport system substrate-binding protein
MKVEPGFSGQFTAEMIDIAMRIWMRTSISLIDVRYKSIYPERPIDNYRLPCSALIYTYGGEVNIQLDTIHYQIERFGLLHGGKGTNVTIQPSNSLVQTYLVLYKTETAPFYRREIHRLLEQVNPFVQLFGFVPKNPILFTKEFERMHSLWTQKASIHQFHAKVVLYQLIHHMYEELHYGSIKFIEPDYVEWVKQYLDQHFAEPISIDLLTGMLPIGRSMLSKLFKKREHKSVQEYLIERRLDEAKKYLGSGHETLQEIAAGCGFSDELNLIRMFKKYNGMTPSDYRRKKLSPIPNCDIDNDYHRLYNEKGLEKLAKFIGDGELSMFGQNRSKEILLAAVVSLMLLLSACTSNVPANNGASPSPTALQTEQGQSTPGTTEASQTRTIHTVKGDVEIPLNPRRIIADTYLGSLIALGVEPVGTPAKFLQNPFYPELLKSIEDIGEQKSISFEKVLDLQPDVIITGDNKAYESYQKIAPTILIPYGELKTDQEEVSYFGEVLGLEQEAKAWLAEYETKGSSMRKKVESIVGANATFSIIEDWGEKNVAVFGDNFGRGGQAVYRLLQLKPPAEHEAEIKKQQMIQLSWEMLEEYAGDYIILTSDRLTLQDLKADPIWSSLEAVKNDRVYIWSSIQGWYFDPLSTLAQAEELTNWLTSK